MTVRDLFLLGLLHLVLVVLVFRAVQRWHRQRHWLLVTASVRRAEVRVLTLNKSQRYEVFTYAYYRVAGQDYEFVDSHDAGLVSGLAHQVRLRENVDQKAAALQDGSQQQTLRYDPADPACAMRDLGTASPIPVVLAVYVLLIYLPATLLYLTSYLGKGGR